MSFLESLTSGAPGVFFGIGYSNPALVGVICMGL